MPDYASAASEYWNKGWKGVLPLPPGQKFPPPKGTTGYDGYWPGFADIQAWADGSLSGSNLGLRLPNSVIGVDVDNYGEKHGGKTLTEAEKRWGSLPPTWRSTSRNDGISGIRLFRVAPGVELETILAFPEMGLGDVEIIQYFHRYTVSWPSIHPSTERVYRWYGQDGMETDIPRVGALPELPLSWIKGLARAKAAEVTVSVDAAGAVAGLSTGQMSFAVQGLLSAALADLLGNPATRHDITLQHVLRLLRASEQNEPGVVEALRVLEEAFVRAVGNDRPGAAEEFRRMITNQRGHALIAQTPSVAGMTGQTLGQQVLPQPAPPATTPTPTSSVPPGGMQQSEVGDVEEEEPTSNDAVWAMLGIEPKEEEGAPEDNRTSWGGRNVKEALGEEWEPERPTQLERDDGALLLYPGRVNALVGEPESAKSWIGQEACAQAMKHGENVAIIDFEDSLGAIIDRMRHLGVPDRLIGEHLFYTDPDCALGPVEQEELMSAMDHLRPTIVMVDGVNAAMTILGMDLEKNTDATKFYQYLLKPLTRNEAAVLTVDHVTKNKMGRGGFAIGAQAKKAMCDGAMIEVVAKEPFGRGRLGVTDLNVLKDKHGSVRAVAQKRGNSDYLATVELDARQAGRVDVRIFVKEESKTSDGTNKKDVTLLGKMKLVTDLLGTYGEDGANKKTIVSLVQGNTDMINEAIEQLVLKGNVVRERRGRSLVHVLVRPFKPDAEDLLGMAEEG